MKTFLRYLCGFIVLLLVGFGALCPASHDCAADFARVFTPASRLPYSELRFVMPDTGELLDETRLLLSEVEQGLSRRAALARWENLQERYTLLYSDLSHAYILRCQDAQDGQRIADYDSLSKAADELEAEASGLLLALNERFACFDENAVSGAVLSQKLGSGELIELAARERELCFEYDQVVLTYRVDFGGRVWSYKDIADDESLSFADWYSLVNAYYNGLNAECSALFLRLADIRRGLAEAAGYDDYRALRNRLYRRDYGSAEIDKLYGYVKTEFAPLYGDLVQKWGAELSYLSYGEFKSEAVMERIGEIIPGEFPFLRESWQLLIDNGLYDLEPSESKLSGSFTTYLARYDEPFIFGQWDGSAQSLFTLIHELGHFARNCYGHGAADSLDLCELDSQGAELLFLPYYEELFGRYADSARAQLLINSLYALLSGCLEDEFTSWVYSNEDADTAALNRRYLELSEEYGLARVHGITGREWVLIQHSFHSPFYYLSYSVGMLAALQLLPHGELSHQLRRVLERPAYAKLSELYAQMGLVNPLSFEGVQAAKAQLVAAFDAMDN